MGRRRSRSGALALALATAGLAVGALATPVAASPPTDPAELATIAPVDTPDIDPVLDAVPVEPTAATRTADARLEEVAAAQNRAVLRTIQATQRRSAFAGKREVAVERAASAARALERARSVQATAERSLRERRKVEARLRAVLADRQAEVRSLAASLYATSTEDRYAVLGTFGDISAADRRDALRDRGSDLQSERLQAARRPWARAHAARMGALHQVREARRATRAATATAQQTATERDQFDQLLAAAETGVRRSVADLDAAREDSRAALVDRRSARLLATVSDLDLPLVALDAYWRAAALAPCHVPWWVIAGIGRTESRHGTAFGSRLTKEGDTTVHILGIPLDGRPGTIAIADSDGGRLDDDPVWDRAVGPMQFIPGTWGRWAVDANADEAADPHNLYDAAGAAARYLCFSRGDLDTEAKIRGALLAYNRSVAYGTEVLDRGRRYRDALDVPDWPGASATTDDPATGGGSGSGPGG